MRLLVDANLSPRVAAILRGSGHDTRHVVEVGLGTASDADILDWAARHDHVIVSSDSDFSALLARHSRVKPSFVLLRHLNELTPDQQAELLRANLPAIADELSTGAVVTFSRNRMRIRSLPFHPT